MTRPRIPPTVWALGFVSLFMDVSSEIVHALLPVFLTVGLGASVALVGLIDGVAESTASIVKVFSGYFSDRVGRRKPFILLGYGLGALSKPFFALAGGPATVLGARFADRVGKGLRGAPRDALVADVTPESIRGRAYGLRQALDTAGAVLGPLLAVALMALFADDMRAVFWIAAVPAALAVVLVVLAVREPTDRRAGAVRAPIRIADLRRLSTGYWALAAVCVAFGMARFGEAFLVLKANAAGLPLTLTPLVLVVMNTVYVLGAYPFGALADSRSPKALLGIGVAVLMASQITLAAPWGLAGAFAGIALWGLHLALTQGVLAKLIAEQAPADLRGSAFGVVNLASGLTMLASSVLAGVLWDRLGPVATFVAGAAFASLAGVALLRLSGRGSH